MVWVVACEESALMQRAGAVPSRAGCALGAWRYAVLTLPEPQFLHLSNGCIGVHVIRGPFCLLHPVCERSVILGIKTHLASAKILFKGLSSQMETGGSLGFCISFHKQLLILQWAKYMCFVWSGSVFLTSWFGIWLYASANRPL